jgi:carboxymethylenebutenolidase
MVETAIELHGPDGIIDGFLYSDESSPRPGVLMLTDIGGIRPSYRESARRLAAEGFSVLLPNVFHRTSRPPLFSFKPSFGDERTTKRLGELAGPLNPEAIERDAHACVEFLTQQPGVSAGAFGVVGYCYSGGMALRYAATCPDKFAAAASFHGGGLCTDAPTSPHLALPQIRARLYFGYAVEDRSMPTSAIDKLHEALAAWGGRYESLVYEGAHHGWTSSDAPVYNPEQAARAFGKLSELFKETL